MKTLELLKEEYAIIFCQYPSWEELLNDIPSHEIEKHTDEVAKLFAQEVAREALRNASENAMLRHDYEDYPISTDWIDKNTILDESNIPEL